MTSDLDTASLRQRLNCLLQYFRNVDVLLPLSIGLAFVVTRLTLALFSDPYGDEAWYFFLSYRPTEWLEFDLTKSHPPFFYVLMCPFAQLGLVPVRLFVLSMSSLGLCLCYALGRDMGAPRVPLLALLTVFNLTTPFYRFSVAFFQDGIVTTALLAGMWLSCRGKRDAASVLFLLAALCKELYIPAAVVLAFMQYDVEEMRKFSKRFVVELAAWFLVGLWFIYQYLVLGGRDVLLESRAASEYPMWYPLTSVGIPAAATVIALSLWRLDPGKRNMTFLGLYVVYWYFIALWGNYQVWYILFPTYLWILLVAASFNSENAKPLVPADLTNEAPKQDQGDLAADKTDSNRRKERTQRQSDPRTSLSDVRERRKLGICTVVLLIAIFVFSGVYHESFQKPNHYAQDVLEEIEDREIDLVLAVDVFWAAKHYPYGTSGITLRVVTADGFDDIDLSRFSWVLFRKEAQNERLRNAFEQGDYGNGSLVYENPEYSLISVIRG